MLRDRQRSKSITNFVPCFSRRNIKKVSGEGHSLRIGQLRARVWTTCRQAVAAPHPLSTHKTWSELQSPSCATTRLYYQMGRASQAKKTQFLAIVGAVSWLAPNRCPLLQQSTSNRSSPIQSTVTAHNMIHACSNHSSELPRARSLNSTPCSLRKITSSNKYWLNSKAKKWLWSPGNKNRCSRIKL